MEQIFSREEDYSNFIRFILPSIVTMIFLSFYTTIDGFFVSRFVNSNALAAINIILPITGVIFGIAVMLATGSGALVGIKVGRKKTKEANELFSFITVVLVIVAILLTIVGIIFIEPILRFLGTTEALYPYAKTYGTVVILMALPMMLKLYFEYYARIDGSPNVALKMSTVGLVFNVVFDFLFIVVFKMGILGAALGTFLAMVTSTIIGIRYFLGKESNLKFIKFKSNFIMLGRSCYNGSSEMLTELSTGITTFLFNQAILSFYGENGIAAMSIVIYIYYFFIAAYFGVAVGVSPVISYSFGAKQSERIKQYLKYSFNTIIVSSVLIFIISFFGRDFIIGIFTTDSEVMQIASEGMRIFSVGFLIIGFNIFMSGYFTSIGNGKISAIISILRSLIFVILGVVILPNLIGVSGIWLTITVAELGTILFSGYFYNKSKNLIEFR
ncbi:MAG: MATE family efflux transporter [Cetobacterium sp.]|uniref:MATE family efflux transporter n=1 Tax=Cetobacterium sp. TaxID=2071632 RepID=UPI003F2DBC1B